MKKPLWLLGLMLPLAGTAAAQSAGACPYLDANTGLTWEHRAGPSFDFCRAVAADGKEVFGVYISREAPFKPSNSIRAEEVTIDGREVTWYRAEIAGTKLQARETLVEMSDRMAQVARRLDEEHPHGDVAIVSHQDPIQAAILRLIGAPLSGLHEGKPGHGTVVSLRPGPAWRVETEWDPGDSPRFGEKPGLRVLETAGRPEGPTSA